MGQQTQEENLKVEKFNCYQERAKLIKKIMDKRSATKDDIDQYNLVDKKFKSFRMKLQSLQIQIDDEIDQCFEHVAAAIKNNKHAIQDLNQIQQIYVKLKSIKRKLENELGDRK